MTPATDEPAPSSESVRLLYTEVCASHAAIADFRAKLLALLPIASGAAVFLLLDGAAAPTGVVLTAAGLFGFVVTLGLFLYELRGIEDCVLLRGRAEYMERVWLKVPPEGGHFLGRQPGRLGDVVSEVGAGWVIYTAVMTSWLYVAGRGAQLDERLFSAWPWLLVGLAAVALGVGLWRWDPHREVANERS
jgi:hypothetical protein